MTSKLRIKIGDVEIDFEGSEGFLKDEVPVLLKAAMDLAKVAPAKAANSSPAKLQDPPLGNLSLTTTTIAARLKVKTGPEMFLAAAAHLTLVAKKDTFTREEVLGQMQSAGAYYKKSYSGNLSKIITSVMSDQNISEVSANVYALTADARTKLGAVIANG